MAKPRRRKARRPAITTIAASALLHLPQIGDDHRPVLDGFGRLVPMFSIDEVRQMTAKQFLSLFEMDHAIYEIWDGPNEWWNYTPRLIQAHRTKTKRDRKNIEKVKRAEKRKVKTVYERQPGPDRRFDWTAFDDSRGADLPAIGYGSTRDEAVSDLRAVVSARKPKRLMQYTAMKATHKRTFGGKVVERRPCR